MNATMIPWPHGKVRERLFHTARVLENAGIAYAVVGGNAVAAWVAKIDEGSVHNTRDVDILIRHADFEAVKVAMVRWLGL